MDNIQKGDSPSKSKQIKIINAGDSEYMNEFMSDLPENVMLNKVSTGCGGTTVALESKSPYVIAVPFKAMINNKMKWARENKIKLQPVMSGIRDSEIIKFGGNKYITTYDSLGRITNILGDEVKNHKLLADECHKLVDSGSFRGDAIRTVLDNYKKYKAYTFMTATPVPDKYQLPELVDIDKVKIKWNNLTPVNVDYITIKDNFNKNIAGIAVDFLDGKHGKSNMHIFINSVKAIIDIILMLNKGGYDTLNRVNIVCADNDRNAEIVERKLNHNYTISGVGDVKKVNFYTATAFEGSDIYDEDGITYVATNGHHDHTKIDIVTTLPQIAGRIRDTNHKNKITLLYTPHSGILELSEDEYEAVVKEHLETAKNSVSAFNSLDNDVDKKALMRGHRDNAYLLERNGELVVNTTAWHAQMAAYSTINTTYYAGGFTDATGTYNDTDYVYTLEELEIENEALKDVKLTGAANFGKLCKLFHKAVMEGDDDTMFEIMKAKPLIEEAYESIGFKRMKALKFVQKSIRQEMNLQDKFASEASTIVKMLGLKTNDFVTRTDIRKKLGSVYEKLGIDKPAMATGLENWYTLTRTTKTIDGEEVEGFTIVSTNIKV